MADRYSAQERRLHIERLRLRARLQRHEATRELLRVRRSLTPAGLWHEVAGSRGSSPTQWLMPIVGFTRRYPYLLSTAWSLTGALVRGRARFVWPVGVIGILAWRMARRRQQQDHVRIDNQTDPFL